MNFSMQMQLNNENSKFVINETSDLISANGVINETIPSNVVRIADGTPNNYTFLASANTLTHLSVADSNNLTYIGNYAFYSCKCLTYVDLSNCYDLKTLGQWCFASCSNIKTLFLPPNVEEYF